MLPPGPTYTLLPLSAASPSGGSSRPTKNPLHAAFSAALSSQLPESLLASLSLSFAALVSALPATYLVYSPLLLLPAHAFATPEWQTLLGAAAADGAWMQGVWAHVAKEMGVEAVAVNAAIPLGASSTSSSSEAAAAETEHREESPSSWNALRSPTGLTPLYGSFGPLPSPMTTTAPTPSDYAAALWVSTRQNGITQTWAPLYTMFSRGNIREKARLLALLPSLHRSPSAPFAALDLYAGIGYFAFSYRRAGARPVLCWELNAWSIEGLRRGAAANGWTTHVVTDVPNDKDQEKRMTKRVGIADADFIVFPHTNGAALADLAALEEAGITVPPIRHINGGLLPSSRGAWRTAARAVDGKMGGWLHLHENFGAEEMERRTGEVLAEVGALWEDARRERMGGPMREGGDGTVKREKGEGVELVHLEKVKTYAPGVWHVVLDVWVPPTEPVE
ncbi:S-adenosyl-L-methionine-dependent methyltransferase [Phyllosticta citrichinensis]|uniref:tRNA wybutosine-synthesizing protein 2 n=1 Tax=Phyllosticta citrichinensis TaxID=1130410 RepID=A0ABR1XPV2_9PEZI